MIIAQRVSSIRHADQIIVIHEGEMAGIGTHDELMAMNGKYAYMYGLQSRYYSENVNVREAEA